MKKKNSIKKRCKMCKIIKRFNKLYNICEKKKHKQCQ